jgi:serine/threonine protein kinase
VCAYQIVLIDFGKATEKNNGKKYNLSFSEQLHYHLHYRHIAPEVINGTMKQSVFSDIYSAGRIMRIIWQGERLEGLDKKSTTKINTIISKCTSEDPAKRPIADDM